MFLLIVIAIYFLVPSNSADCVPCRVTVYTPRYHAFFLPLIRGGENEHGRFFNRQLESPHFFNRRDEFSRPSHFRR